MAASDKVTAALGALAGGQAQPDGAGKAVSPSGAISDVAQPEANEEAQLRKSEERLALAVRASDSGIWDWDLGSDEMFYSARFRELLGYPNLSNDRFRSAFSFRDNLHPEDRERTLAAVQRALHTLEPFNQVHRMRCADGRSEER